MCLNNLFIFNLRIRHNVSHKLININISIQRHISNNSLLQIKNHVFLRIGILCQEPITHPSFNNKSNHLSRTILEHLIAAAAQICFELYVVCLLIFENEMHFGCALEFGDKLCSADQLVVIVWVVRQKVYSFVNLPGLLKKHESFTDVHEVVVILLRVLVKRQVAPSKTIFIDVDHQLRVVQAADLPILFEEVLLSVNQLNRRWWLERSGEESTWNFKLLPTVVPGIDEKLSLARCWSYIMFNLLLALVIKEFLLALCVMYINIYQSIIILALIDS